jgi:hypothetical protein
LLSDGHLQTPFHPLVQKFGKDYILGKDCSENLDNFKSFFLFCKYGSVNQGHFVIFAA